MSYTPGKSGVSPSTAGVANWVKAPSGKRHPGGYDAWSRRNAKTADQKGSSGSFSRLDGSRINMWITKVTADFSIGVETGQSRLYRETFPRSFNDVTLTITGNVPNTQEFNRLSLFIRETQWNALSQNSSTDQTITFSLDNTSVSSNFPYSAGRNVKGPHRPWTVTGYVRSCAGGAVRHEIAPEFRIAFIVTTSQLTASTGIWSDIAADPSTLKNILDMLPHVPLQKNSKFVQGSGNDISATGKSIASGAASVTPSPSNGGLIGDIWTIAASLKSLGLL